jgi:hypothetical protein
MSLNDIDLNSYAVVDQLLNLFKRRCSCFNGGSYDTVLLSTEDKGVVEESSYLLVEGIVPRLIDSISINSFSPVITPTSLHCIHHQQDESGASGLIGGGLTAVRATRCAFADNWSPSMKVKSTIIITHYHSPLSSYYHFFIISNFAFVTTITITLPS